MNSQITTKGAKVFIRGSKNGPPGPRGPAFQVDATGPFTDRTLYDGEGVGFSFLATDTGYIYFREGEGWSAGMPFQGPEGVPGADGATWLSGIGAPSDLAGEDGDFYLDTSVSAYHGPKASGVWPAGVSLVGPQGPQGIQGEPGADATYSNVDPQPLGAEAAPGVAAEASRSDHVHVRPTPTEIGAQAVATATYGRGVSTKPAITYASPDIQVSGGDYYVFGTADFTGALVFLDAVPPATLTITDEKDTYYLYVFNNGLGGAFGVTKDSSVALDGRYVPIARIIRTGTSFHTSTYNELATGFPSKMQHVLEETLGFQPMSGLNISVAAVRAPAVSSGEAALGAAITPLAAVGTTLGDNFLFTYWNGTDWVVTPITQLNNLQYQTASGLATLDGDKYAVNWIWRGVEDEKHVYVLLGEGNYKLEDAQQSAPTVPPDWIAEHALLVGRVLFVKNSDVAIIEQISQLGYSALSVVRHDDTTNKSGDGPEFYHLNAEQFAVVPQLEAEGGLAETKRMWSTLRVRQAIEAWWAAVVNTVAPASAATMAGTSYDGTTSGLIATTGQGAIDETMSNMSMGVNDIINGQFQIAQTGTAFVSPASGVYDLDGWIRHGVGGVVTITRVAGSVTGSYARESNVTTAKATLAGGDYEIAETRLLGYDCVKYINQPFVVAAKITSGVTGIHCVSLRNGTSSFIHEINILSANTPQDVVIPVPMGVPSLNSSTNQYGFNIGFTQAAGTTFQTATTDEWVVGNFIGTANQINGLSTVGNKLTIEDVRINLGTVPLPNVTPYDAELARCRRYVRRYGSPGTNLRETLGSGYCESATEARIAITFDPPMNDTPIFNSINASVAFTVSSSGVSIAAPTLTQAIGSSIQSAFLNATDLPAVLTTGRGCIITVRPDFAVGAYIQFSARL